MGVEKNEGMRPALEALRSETQGLFEQAQELKDRWGHIEEAQVDMYRVRPPFPPLSLSSY